MKAFPIAICLATLASSPAIADEQADLRARYEAEAAPAWEAYRAEARKLSGSMVTQHFERAPNRRLELEIRGEWLRRDNSVMYLEARHETKPVVKNLGVVHAFNSDYSFTLRSVGIGGKWMLTEAERGRGKMAPNLERDVDNFAEFPIGLHTAFARLRDVATRPGYDLKSLTRVHDGDASLIRVDFAYEPEDAGAAIAAVSGWFKYDTDNFWVVRELDVEIRFPEPAKKTVTTSAVFVYDYGKAKIPLLRKIEQTMRSPSQLYDQEWITSFEWRETVPDEGEFTLPAFGIDEPVEVRE